MLIDGNHWVMLLVVNLMVNAMSCMQNICCLLLYILNRSALLLFDLSIDGQMKFSDVIKYYKWI